MTNRILRGWRAALLTGLVLVAYAGGAPAEFIYDDEEGIQHNSVINGDLPLTAALTHDFWGRTADETVGTYRPVPVLVSAVVWRLGGGTPYAFRAVSLLLHISVVVSAFLVFSSLIQALMTRLPRAQEAGHSP